MPYTKEELQDVDFYREFVDKLRHTYLDRMSESAARFFRDDTGALVSYEAIDNGLGLEDADFTDPMYSTLLSALGGPELSVLLNRLNQAYNTYINELIDQPGSGGSTGLSAEALENLFGSDTSGMPTLYQVSDVPAYIRTLSFTVVINKKYPEYIKTSNLERIIDRSISELSTESFAETLPDGIENGMIVTSDDADDFSKWLIENNQKKIFPDLETFWGTSYRYTDLKTITLQQLNRIPDGEPVE